MFSLFKRGRRQAREQRVQSVREAVDAGDVPGALERCRLALLAEPAHPDVLRVAGEVAVHGGDGRAAELFGRAADGAGEVGALFELGSYLLSLGDADLAIAMLERALTFAPFDAVIRSELALAQTRAGRPQAAVATLALHPCLVDDPGALFTFGWASLLAGDLVSARHAEQELTMRRSGELTAKLGVALRRAAVAPASDPPNARDYLYLEHGAVLLDAAGPLGGRYDSRPLDPDDSRALVDALARVIVALDLERSTVWHTARAAPLAAVIGFGSARAIEDEPVSSGVVMAANADELAQLDIAASGASVATFALVLDWTRPVGRVPDFVGLLAGSAPWQPPASSTTAVPDPALAEFVAARAEHLPPRGRRVATAYLPDAPLPWGYRRGS